MGAMVSGDETTVAAQTITASRDGVDRAAPDEWIETDRYTLIEEIGRGGGGSIAVAIDRKLGRRVALKRPVDGGGARLEREARVMAKLEHPGIVPVHDAGRAADGTPFYAMKLLGGADLGERIKSCGSLVGRLALVRVVGAVADAMAYAHAQGVIHRDLKPSNVVVGEFGEVAVIDWGLAKVVAGAGADAAASGDPIAGAELTADGAVVGTPAYMAPEQAMGLTLDARTDVYALGAMLYHVLTGSLPYGSGLGAAEQVARLRVGAPPAVSEREPRVPRELAAIVGKAMMRDPSRRYDSARDLADDLNRYQTGRLVAAHRYSLPLRARKWLRRHPVVVGLAIASLAVAGAAAYVMTRTPAVADTCVDLDRPVVAVWNDARRAAIAKAFDATGVKYAASAWRVASDEIDERARAIAVMRRDACHAHAIGAQSSELLDRRMTCIDDRLDELRAVLDVAEHADRDVVRNVEKLTATFGDPAECADTRLLRDRPAPPTAPGQRELRARVGERGATFTAHVYAGQMSRALGEGPAVIALATAAGDDAALGRLFYQYGVLLEDRDARELAEAVLRSAVLAAERGHDDRARGFAMHKLARLAVGADRRDEGARLIDQAEAIAARIDDPSLLVDVLHDRADLAYRSGHGAEAVAIARRALTIGQTRLNLTKLASLHGNLGSYLVSVRKNDEAIHELEQAVALVRAFYHGDNHPDVAIDLMSLAGAMYQQNRTAEAAETMKQAIAIFDRFVAPDSITRLSADQNYGTMLTTLGRTDEAIAILSAALPRAEAKVGARANLPLGIRYNLGMALDGQKRYDEALVMYRSVVELTPRGQNEGRVMDARYAIANVMLATDRAAEALPELREVLAYQEKALGPDSYDAAFTRADLGRALMYTGDLRGAIDALVRAMPEIDREGGDGARGKYHFALGRARWEHGEHDAARAEMETARAAFSVRGQVDADDLSTVDEWIASHRDR